MRLIVIFPPYIGGAAMTFRILCCGCCVHASVLASFNPSHCCGRTVSGVRLKSVSAVRPPAQA